ncbi:MAG: hypothetical protein ABII85_01695 [Bacillota bacterium]
MKKSTYKDQLMQKLDGSRNAYIESLKNYIMTLIAQHGIDLEEKDLHIIANIEEELK